MNTRKSMYSFLAAALLVLCGFAHAGEEAPGNAIVAMTPLSVAPWLKGMSEGVREALVHFIPEDKIESFDEAVRLLATPLGVKKVPLLLAEVSKTLKREAVGAAKLFLKEHRSQKAAIRSYSREHIQKLRNAASLLKDFAEESQHAIRAFVQRRKLYVATGKLASELDMFEPSFLSGKLAKKAKMNAIDGAASIIGDLAKAYQKARKSGR